MVAYLRTAVTLCRATGTGAVASCCTRSTCWAATRRRQLAFFPGMDLPSRRKAVLFERVLRHAGRALRAGAMSTHARALLERGRAWRCARRCSRPERHVRLRRHPDPLRRRRRRRDAAGARWRTPSATAGRTARASTSTSRVGFHHKRLAIIDLATGQQPMTSGPCTIVFNGEIYNYVELREELRRRGHEFRDAARTPR